MQGGSISKISQIENMDGQQISTTATRTIFKTLELIQKSKIEFIKIK